MGCDMVVALGSATANGKTFFAGNCHDGLEACCHLRLLPGKAFAAGETVQTQHLLLPQVRQTCTVLGWQPAHAWGLCFGINEHRLAIGFSHWLSKLSCPRPGLEGADLVRLILERCRNARQAFDLLTGLVARFGQGNFPHSSQPALGDHIFLLADPKEAFLVETAGSSWASLECREVRAVSDVALIRQDWHRIAPGLADQAISLGWWQDDGSKLDFSPTLALPSPGMTFPMRRWGRATFLLEQQNGNIDASFLRRLLADHYEEPQDRADPFTGWGPLSLCLHPHLEHQTTTQASFIAELAADLDRPPLAWCAFGPPCASVFLPVFLEGELPDAWGQGRARPETFNLGWRNQMLLNSLRSDPQRWERWRSGLASLQARIDQETDEFLAETSDLRRHGPAQVFQRQASLFMQNHAEQLETEFHRVRAPTRLVPVV